MNTLIKISFFLSLCFISCKKTTDKHKFTIGFVQLTTDDDWRKSMNQSMRTEAGFHKNVKLIISDGQSNVDKQIADVEDFIEKKVDVLIISPLAPKPLKAILQKAINTGIPVIVVDRKIDDLDYTSFIGTSNYEIGINAGNYIASFDKKEKIIEIKGWAGTTPTKQRSLGFQNAIKSNKNLSITGIVQERYDESSYVKKEFKRVLKKNTDADIVFAHNDFSALQAYKIAKQLNLHHNIQFIGVGGLGTKNGGMDLVQKGILNATILYPTGGKEAFRTAVKILNNEPVQKNYTLPSVVIDSTNVTLLKRQAQLVTSQELDIKRQQSKIDSQLKLYNSQRDFLKWISAFLVLTALFFIRTYRSEQKLKKQKKLLEKQKDKISVQKTKIEQFASDLEESNKARTNFFTGVSHDFKTPITLILSSVESLVKSTKNKEKEEYVLIYNNSKRLLRLINQLLDFRRVESKKFNLKASQTNLYNFVHNIYIDFKSEALKNNIDFTLHTNNQELEAYIDRDLFDNILFNLLSNAFKFTPIDGKISINIVENDNHINISVTDSGIGILANEKEKVFNLFFQGSNNNQTSSGIGLYLTREFIKLHGGKIEVISDNGTEFKIQIPKGKEHLDTDQIIISDSIDVKDTIRFDTFTNENKTEEDTGNSKEDKNTLLIIEDNTDLRVFLKNKLSQKYTVYESDGIDAIEKATSIIPDIIISDVNLPDKNGFEICKTLKKDVRTSHIPIIILTALSTSEAHLQGLKADVDMFLTKPFNLSVLFQSLKTLLYNRKKLQQYYNATLSSKKTKKARKVAIKDTERSFLLSIDEIIEKNIDDSSFTVEMLAEELHISRVQLYRKVKAILGIGINDYIQNIRLEKAKELLLEDKELSIADVAYSVGFSSSNYFSTAFKNKFGKSPKKFSKT